MTMEEIEAEYSELCRQLGNMEMQYVAEKERIGNRVHELAVKKRELNAKEEPKG